MLKGRTGVRRVAVAVLPLCAAAMWASCSDQNPISPVDDTANATTNHAPTITLTPTGPYKEGTPVLFTVVVKDADHDLTSQNWDFGDGVVRKDLLGDTVYHTFADNGPYVVSVIATDAHGRASAEAKRNITVRNVAPVILNFYYDAIFTPGPIDFHATWTDPGALDHPASYRIVWGDHTPDYTGVGALLDGVVDEDHLFTGPGPFTVTLTITDKDGGVSTTTLSATPGNNAPTAAINGPYSGVEGAPIAFSSAGTSDDVGEKLTYLWNFGDGTTSTAKNPIHRFNVRGEYIVILTVTDPAGATAGGATTVEIADKAPTSKLHVPITAINEGDGLFIALNAGKDPNPNDIPNLLYAFDCGDGAGYNTASTDTTYFCPPAADQGTRTVKASVTDRELTTEYTTTVTVANVAPAISYQIQSGDIFAEDYDPYTIGIGQQFQFEFTLDDPGAADGPLKYTVDWGDHSPLTQQTGPGSESHWAYPFTHYYGRSGDFTVTMKGRDKDNALTIRTFVEHVPPDVK